MIDKPPGVSSRYCVDRIGKAIGDRAVKVGHAGTLDPMATGVLLIAVGEATKLVEHLHDLDKAYSAQFEFGKDSDTLDRDGTILEIRPLPIIERADLEQACIPWIGSVMQRPPCYSAIKVQGSRAYDRARRGEQFELAARRVEIHRLELLEFHYPQWTIEIDCGSGTYVRSLGRDLAAAVGQVAIMTNLVRTAIGPFSLESAFPLDAFVRRSDVEARLQSPVGGLVRWPSITVDPGQTEELQHGRFIKLDEWRDQNVDEGSARTQRAAVTTTGELIALITVSADGSARPVRVFRPESWT